MLTLASLHSVSVSDTSNALEGRNMKVFSVLVVLLLSAPVFAQSEAEYNEDFCESVGGKTETKYIYLYPTGRAHIRVDCETEDTVYEGGLDKRSSLDSVQQALFFSSLTGKQPAVVIYDTDGQIGRFEHRIRVVSVMAGVTFLRVEEEPME